jgi:hypothetical protein
MMSQIKDGIEVQHEGRYFFEEVGHLRRITSGSLEEAVRNANPRLEVQTEMYSGHTWAALEWMTSAPPWSLARMLNPMRAVNLKAGATLATVAASLLALNALRWPAHAASRLRAKLKVGLQPKHLLYAVPLPALPISWPFDLAIRKLTMNENQARLDDPSGSQMAAVIGWKSSS